MSRHIPDNLRFRVFIRDGFRCTACGRSPITHPGVVLHCDHVEELVRGGKTIMANLKTLCSVCNRGKGNMMIKHYAKPVPIAVERMKRSRRYCKGN